MYSKQVIEALCLVSLYSSIVVAQGSNATASIPSQLTYLLPPTFINNSTEFFLDTSLPPSASSDQNENITSITEAREDAFISYSTEFTGLLGSKPVLRPLLGPLPSHSNSFYEAGQYDPDHNLLFFTGASPTTSPDVPSHLAPRIVLGLNLTSNELFVPNVTEPILVANGGAYHDGKLYIAHWGNYSYAGGIVQIDPLTFKTETLINSYYGVRFNGPDDVAWVRGSNNNSVMFYTDVDFSADLNFTGPAQLPNAIWRFDPANGGYLRAVIPRADVPFPNGVAVSPNGKRLYVTDSPVSNLQRLGPGNSTGSAATYVYDLDDTLTPVNKRLFAIARTGIADGIKTDAKGRLWSAEGEGIVCRNQDGRVLGLINANVLLDQRETPIANFALVQDRILVLAVNRIWAVKLTETLSWTS
ncbi:hypothetical protein H2200_011697 [Cladophialophora chaetospira]|uniref:SMP-30/Gluconolactonase/LRE-like region domain-containing protein n=1 Tax=Cladophialophora chaetospira TaxID=386627 RepID=A0AA38WYK0_9EURO|nr:hypothetical protein H2200_011697 [Cladophialophora chaetospira]